MKRYTLLILAALLPILLFAQNNLTAKNGDRISQTAPKPQKRLTRADDNTVGAVATLQFEKLPDMNTARMGHQVFLSGSGFAVVGGHTTDFKPTQTAELYENGQWKDLSIGTAHDNGFAVTLSDGRVMIGGGYSSASGVGQSKMTTIYSPTTKTFTAGPDMTTARANSKAIAIGSNVYVSGNWYADDKVIDCYNGTSFTALADMDGRVNPYLFTDKSGNVYSLSPQNTQGGSFGFYTASDGSQALSADEYNVTDGNTYYYRFPFYSEWVPLPLSSDVRASDYHYLYNGSNCFLVLTQKGGEYLLTEACPDDGKTYNYTKFGIPTKHPTSGAAITYRAGVFVNPSKTEIYLIGTSGTTTNQTLHLISYNYENGNWTIASASGFTHNLQSASWTMLSDGRLVCTGGGINSNFDAQKSAYIFTPMKAGESGTSGGGTGSQEVEYDNTGDPTQDAFYVYRNDGSFNAFYFADVDRITYSKVDTLGIEHDDYVVQEVYALDSIFRIPVSAIDSVAFVSPKTQYKQDVAFTTTSDLWSYVIATDSVSWITLRSNTPTDIIPKVGDKLVNLNQSAMLPAGFMGKVSSVTNVGDGIRVTCGEVELTEIFDQYVCKVAATATTDGSKVRTRSEEAGSVSIRLPEMGATRQLTGSFGGANFSIDGTGSIGLAIKPSLDIRMFLSVGWGTGTNFDFIIRGELESKITLAVNGALTGHFDVPVVNNDIPIPQFPLFMMNMQGGIFAEAQGSVNFGCTFSSRDRLYSLIQYNNIEEGNRQALISLAHLKDTLEWSDVTGKVTLSAGIYAQNSFKCLSAKIQETGVRCNVGLREELEAQIKWDDFNTSDLIPGSETYLNMLQSEYKFLNRNASVNQQLFANGQVFSSVGLWKVTKTTEATIGAPVSGGLVPDISKPTVRLVTTASDSLHIDATMERPVPVAVKVGYDIYDEKSQLVKELVRTTSYLGGKNPETLTMAVANLNAGTKYVAYPRVEFLGWKMYAEPTDSFTTDPSKLDIPVKEFFISPDNGKLNVKVNTNITNISFTSSESWLSCFWWPDKQELEIIYEALPQTLKERKATIHVTAKDGDDKTVLEEADLSITQVLATIKLSTKDFQVDAGGTTSIVNIISTDVSNITVTTTSNFLHPEVNGNTISIVVDVNTSTESREGTVVVSGTLASTNQKVEEYIHFTQIGSGSGVNGQGIFTGGNVYLNLTAYENGGMSWEGVRLTAPFAITREARSKGYTTENGNILTFHSSGDENFKSTNERREVSWVMEMNIDKGDGKSLACYKVTSGSMSYLRKFYKTENNEERLIQTTQSSFDLKDFNRTSCNFGDGSDDYISFSPSEENNETIVWDNRLSDYLTFLSYEETGYDNATYSLGNLRSVQYEPDDHYKNWSMSVDLVIAEGTPLLEPNTTLLELEDGYGYSHHTYYHSNDLVSDITVTTSADWLTIENWESFLTSGTFNIVFTNNTSQADRLGYVYLSGKLADGSTLTRTITVKQPYTRFWDDRWETKKNEKAVLPDEETLTELENHGMQIYTGSTPPAVSGVFEFKPMQLLYSSDPENYAEAAAYSMVFKIESATDGTPRAKLYYYNYSDADGAFPPDTLTCYLGGSGKNFTISNITEVTDDNPRGVYTYTMTNVLSGEVDGNNVNNLQLATIFVDDEGRTVNIGIDGDGVSTPTTWAPGAPWDERDYARRRLPKARKGISKKQ